jgi:hypothetical protein
MSTGYKAGMFYNGVLTKPFTFPSEIINIQSAYTTSPNGAYPTNLTTHDISAGGYFWFDLPPCSNINVTTLNNKLITTSSLVCPEIKTLASEIDVKNHINMNSNNLTNVELINGLSVVQKGGLYAQTSLFAFTGILSETIIRHGGGLSYGVPLIKANCFMGGDTFLIKVSGKITGAIGDTFIFRVRLNMKSSPLTLAIFNVVLDSALTTIWNVECICSLQNVAVTNTMFTDARYSYFNSSGYLKGVAFNGTTSINTTIDNEIGFTYETPNNLTFTVSNTIINKLY